jgi:hypothetical protein
MLVMAVSFASPCLASAPASKGAAARAALLNTDVEWAATVGTGDVERIGRRGRVGGRRPRLHHRHEQVHLSRRPGPADDLEAGT